MDTGLENLLSRLIYVPANLRALTNYLCSAKVGTEKKLWKDKYVLNWWSQNSIFHHPYILLSFWFEGRDAEWRDNNAVSGDVEVFGDCGAYSATSEGVNLDPAKVADWQIRNCEVGFTLDKIPATLEKKSQAGATKHRSVPFRDFKRFADDSRKNYEIAIERAKGYDLKLLAVMHGDTPEKWNYWWGLIKDLKVAGYATGLKPTTNAVLQMSCLARLHSCGVKSDIHLLGVSGTNVIPALAWASKNFNRVTFDSMSYAQGSISKAYMMFNGFRREIRGFGKAYDIHPKGDPFPCECPVCQEICSPELLRDENDHIEWGNDTFSGLLIALHNLFQYNEYTKKCLAAANSYDKAEDMIKEFTGTRNEEAIAGIRFWEDYVNRGIETTMYLWREKLAAKLEEDNTLQMQLF